MFKQVLKYETSPHFCVMNLAKLESLKGCNYALLSAGVRIGKRFGTCYSGVKRSCVLKKKKKQVVNATHLFLFGVRCGDQQDAG